MYNYRVESPQSIGAPSAKLLAAVRRVLRPLVRLLLARGVTYPLLQELTKEVYIDVANREFTLEGKRQTDSRLSLLTGVHRKDVRRLRAAPVNRDTPAPVVSLGVQLVSRWISEPRFHGPDGRPAPLPRSVKDDAGESFESLARSVSTDIRPRALLDELLRLGVVHIDAADCVLLDVDAFLPRGFDEKAFFLGRNVGDHLAAAVHNVLDGSPPLLERSVEYDALAPESVAQLSELADQLGMSVLRELNTRARELEQRDASRPDARRRFNFGIYFYHADRDD